MLDYIQVGDLGKNRDKFIQKVTRSAGKGNWFWTFRCNNKLYSWEMGMQMYEDAYWQFLRNDVSLVKELVGYFNVYVLDRHDIDSSINYKHQLNERDHYPDIALRRCLVRLGVWFQGKEILRIPATKFNDCNVPFHLPHLIQKPDDKKSIKSWLDSNRYIVIAPDIEDKCKLSDILVS